MQALRRATRASWWRAAAWSCVAAATPAVAQAPAASYRATWGDAVALVALAGLAAAPVLARLPRGAPACAPCDPARLPALDRGVVGARSTFANTASDVLLVGVLGGAAAALWADTPAAARRGDAMMVAQSVAATYAVTGWLKVAVRRERPVLYTARAAAAADDPDSQRSFPSSHTAAAFAAATSYLVVSERRDLPHRTRTAMLLYAGATATGGMRIAAGEHFPTDVLAAAALGALVGWLVPTVHR
jgi:membrane-associated phospholipid phosphatase